MNRPAIGIVRLSSKSHWDIPILIGKKTVHFLVSHPTPPVSTGPRTGTVAGTSMDPLLGRLHHPGKADYIYDDQGRTAGSSQESSS